MANTINVNISPKAAVRLVISNDIDLDGYWPMAQAECILETLYNTSIEEILSVIDCIEPQMQIESLSLPQFGSLETLIRVPEVLISTGTNGLTYTQLGFYLKGDITAKQSANSKFGETHGKGACQIGIACCHQSRIGFGSLTNAFYDITDNGKKLILARLLCFRVQAIQTLLYLAKKGRINGFSIMAQLEKSTQIRRGICLRMILRELATFESADLSARLQNIYWEAEKGVSGDA